MLRQRPLFTIPLLLACAFLFAQRCYPASLNIDTDYRLRSVNYTNNDFDTTTSTDSIAYYSQRVQLSVIGNLAPDVEVGTKITALGVVESTSTPFAVPYPRTDFTPFIETAYIKMSRFAGLPLDVIIGRQNITYGEGLLISDNGTGMNALRFIGRDVKPLPWQAEIMIAKLKEGFQSSLDRDLMGVLTGVTWRKHLWEFNYFKDDDYSGTTYRKGSLSSPTSSIVKQFFDLRIGRKEKDMSYQLEIVKQGGYVVKTSTGQDRQQIGLDGFGYVASGELIGEKTKLGRVTAHALLAVASGDDNTSSLDTDDKSFTPSLTRRFDGLERKGYGELFAASPFDSFFTIPDSFSGINTLNVGATFSPLYAWTLGVDYFLYSASQGPRGATDASGFERLFGANFTLGIELDISVKYVHSKYFETRFSYNRYTPPKLEAFWPKSDPATRYQLEFAAKF